MTTFRLPRLRHSALVLAMATTLVAVNAGTASAQNFTNEIPIPIGGAGTPPKVMKGTGSGERLTSGNYRLIMQGDGNLVLYQGTRACWGSGTNHRDHLNNTRVDYQWDGNFVIYRIDVTPRVKLWASNTVGDWDDDATVSIYNGRFYVGHRFMGSC